MYALCALYVFAIPLVIAVIGGVLMVVLGETVGTALYLCILLIVQLAVRRCSRTMATQPIRGCWRIKCLICGR